MQTNELEKLLILLESSNLPNHAKQTLKELVQTSPADNVTKLIKEFENNQQALLNFWTLLEKKLAIIATLQNNEQIHSEEKNALIERISAMNNEELAQFLKTLDELRKSDNPQALIKQLLNDKIESENTLTRVAEDTLRALSLIKKNLE